MIVRECGRKFGQPEWRLLRVFAAGWGCLPGGCVGESGRAAGAGDLVKALRVSCGSVLSRHDALRPPHGDNSMNRRPLGD